MAKKILIIEDDPLSGEFLKLVLESENHIVQCATSCSEAIKILEVGAFDTILSDINLPDGSPQNLLHTVRNSSGTTRIVGLTGYSQEDLPEGIDKNFFDGFLQKPVDLTQLLTLI